MRGTEPVPPMLAFGIFGGALCWLPILWMLAGCAPLELSSSLREPGAPPRAFATPRVIFLTVDSPEQIALLPKAGWADDVKGVTVGMAKLFPVQADGKPGACFVTVPPPKDPDDVKTWRIWFHEIMRHCNGQMHDDRGVWLH